tara:strand:- start:7179 stop:7517 length:339 start_codon:yes stop_codon:yes gene_type:complete
MNNCNFVGRIASDIALKDVGSTKLAIFSIAVEEHRKDKEGNKKKRVDFFEFEAWDTGAITIHKMCQKGDMVAVQCCARQQKWTDSEGKSKQKVNFRMQSFKVFHGKEPSDEK